MNRTAEIYTLPNCHYCVKAKALLELLAEDVVEISAKDEIESLTARLAKLGKPRPMKAPQIFLDGFYIGGHDDLVEYLN